MSIHRQSLLAAAAALRAVAEATTETQEAEEMPTRLSSQLSGKRARSVSPTQAYQAEAAAQERISTMVVPVKQDFDEQEPPATGLPTPPLPKDAAELSKRASTILRHRPRGCEFCVDGSALLDDIARLVGILPTTLWSLVTEGPGPQRLPRWETAVVDGDLRIRATYKHTYKGFDSTYLRNPMASGTPVVDAEEYTDLRAGWQVQEDRRRERNQKAHQRKRMRRSNSW